MTEKDIILLLAKWLDSRQYPYQLPNCFMYMWESDFWAMNAKGETREFEIKISVQDFKLDQKKEKHQSPDKGANYFYYVCPAGMITPTMINRKYGLIYVEKYGGLKVVKRPQRLR